ncbi:unnamed protein product [Effrenium voratum]|nr:unnamed protein product [Effrenium voratum]
MAKGQTADTHAQQQFRANLHAAFRVGWWTVLLSLPIIAWPVAAWLQETGKMENEYLGYWGSMLLQFLFCVGPTLGASVKYGLDGLLGTVLAWANMLLLNNVTGDWMSGGAYTDRIEFFDNTTQSLVVTSKWFPLCGNGKDLSYNNCILNVNADLGHEAQFGKAAVVLLDFVIFVFLILFLGFNTNVRTFSISTHVYFAMTFLNPATGSFDISPSLATNYLGIVVCSSLALWICFLFPAPITSRARARALLETTGSAVAMLLEALPLTPSELCRAKAQAAVEEMATLMKDLDFHLAMMWFEDFGILQRRARYRRWLQSYAEVLKASIRNCDAVLCAAAALPLKESEQLAALLPSLRHECVLLASTLRALLAVKTPDEVKPVVHVLLEKRQALREQLSGEFEKGQRAENLLLPPGLVFVLAVTGVLQDTCEALSSLTLYDSEEQRRSCCQRIARYVASMQSHMEFKLYERSITHPRFVLRHTISLTLTFIIGWLGVSNVIAPYSSQPAVVVSVIIYTYTGSSIPLTLKRLNGVVLGNVMGSMAQRLFAVQTVGHATCFAIFQLVTVTLLIFLAFHSKQHGGVALLTAAYAMSTAMPVDGMFREREVKLTDSDGSFLFSKVTGTFIGVAVLLLVDFLLGSSARRQAKQRLLRSVGRVSAFIGQVLDPADQQRDVEKGEEDDADVAAKLQAGIYDDLDELVALLTYASDEPSFDGRPFPTDLFKNLEKGLRIIARHFRIVQWAIQILEKPQKRMVLRAGSRIFKALTPSAKAEPVLRTELFRPILATLASEMQLMLENIRVIASGMVWSQPWSAKQERQDAERVKELLRNKLYTKTVSNAFCRIARSPWRTAWKVARAEQESTNVATARVGLEHLGLDDLISPSPLLRGTLAAALFSLERQLKSNGANMRHCFPFLRRLALF